MSDIGGKKLFCKEIEEDLLANNIWYSNSLFKGYGVWRTSRLNDWSVYKKWSRALVWKIVDLNKLKVNTKIGSAEEENFN